MKDLPHHMQKLNRRVIRDANREDHHEEVFELNADLNLPPRSMPPAQLKKQGKIRRAKQRNEHIPIAKTPDEQNKLIAKRNPVFFSKNHQKPKTTRATRKKTPRMTKGRKAA